MTLLPPHLTHVAVRWLHVLGMAVVFGGAALVWLVLRDGDDHRLPPAPGSAGLRVAAAYEWLFWAATGLLVLTGVGNLGTMAPAVPGLATPWGSTFAVKLAGVLALLLGSLVRSVGVVGLLATRSTATGSAVAGRLRRAYAATAVYLLALVALAEVLAHG